MRTLIPALALVLLASLAAAQPKDGDVILSFAHDYNSLFDQGRLMYFDPSNPAVLSTLAVNSVPSFFHNCVSMAPGNHDLVVGEQRSDFLASRLMQVTPAGFRSTIVTMANDLEGIELDGDDTWIAAGSTALYGVHHTSSLVTTFFTDPTMIFTDVAIVREGTYPYAVSNFSVSSLLVPRILGASRNGLLGTMVATAGNPLAQLSGIELQSRRGDLIATDFDGPPWEPNGTEVSRVTLGGQVSTLYALWGANAARVDQMDTAWIAGFIGSVSSLQNAVIRFDLSTQTVLTIYQLPQIDAQRWSISGIEIYGSRVLTCNGVGASLATIQVNLHSQHPLAPGQSYQIACSFARRPNVQMPGGEWLCLNVTDTLFLLTAQNLAATVFRRFAGTLDGNGGASAEIRLPSGIPTNLGVTIFCAAVIYNASGIVQVSNTHWFGL